jgi:lysophospholipase L1-like esterase
MSSRDIWQIPSALGTSFVFALLIPSQAAAQVQLKNRPPIAIPQQVIANLPGPAPTILSLIPASATNVTISWSVVPGAVRYLISRNGAADVAIDANAGFLQNNQFRYTDVGRKPATLYTYSVTAQFPAPGRPGRSAPARILMPTAFAPANFRAAGSGPNAVTLTWSGRPEAQSYRLTRSGGNQQAIELDISGLLFVDQNTSPGTTYTISSIIKLASGELYNGESSLPLTLNVRPFNILAIGDSIMWGQGLHTADKFSSKTAAWIGSQIGIPTALSVRAHSGAITYPDPGAAAFESFSYDGEVPTSYPTISHQIDLASAANASNVPATDVDLVLVDGCTNNLGITTVILPYPDDNQLQSDIQGYCNNGMSNILTKTVQAFPNADVIATGYFRLVSMKTDLRTLLPLFGFLSTKIPSDPISAALGADGNLLQLRSAARSDLFYNQTNTALQAAVDFANTTRQIAGRTRFNQVHFASISPTLDNSYGAPNTWQWLLPAPPLYQDDVYPQRQQACDQAAAAPHDPSMDIGFFCYNASLGHPNVLGAQAFASAIEAVATPLLPQWRSPHLSRSTETAAVDAVVVGVQYGVEEAGGGTLVVTAADGPTGALLPGRVQFNGADAGPLGVSLRYGYQPTNPTDILATVQIAGRVPRNFVIPVRTFSVAVDVNNSAVVVTATDSITGRPLSGNVIVNANSPSAVTAQTGQPISFSVCAPTQFHPLYVPGQPPCGGIVHVGFYPDVRY